MLTVTTATYTCRASAEIPSTGDAGPLLDAVLAELEHDERAIAPVCGYDYDHGRVECTFQIENEQTITGRAAPIDRASSHARTIFDAALLAANAHAATSALAIVAGGDPDLLP